MCVLVEAAGAVAISRQREVGVVKATSEAQEDASVLAFTVGSEYGEPNDVSQRLCRFMFERNQRDIEVVNLQKRVIVDSHPEEVGGMSDHLGPELDATLKDGKPRTFLVMDPGHPQGLRHIVVPMFSDDTGKIIGGVVEEYTPIYDEFMAITEATTREVVYGTVASVLVAMVLAIILGTSIARPLRQLTKAAVGFAAGQKNVAMPEPRNDEIGDLAVAFGVMMERRREAEAALERTRDELVLRVKESTERSAELAEMNGRLQREVTVKRKAEETARVSEERVRRLADDLARERERFADILDNVPAMVFEQWSAEDQRPHFVSKYVETLTGFTPREWLSTPDFWKKQVHPDDQKQMREKAGWTLSGIEEPQKTQFRFLAKDGRVVWVESYIAMINDPETGTKGVRGFSLDITEQKRAEQELHETHQKLVEASRQAGMAEVATSVLHNVGNVLNSVNVSATVVADSVRNSSASHLGRVAELLTQKRDNLGAYLTTDPAGSKLPAFLSQLAGQLEIEKTGVLGELEQLGRNIEHIKDIVAMQQNYATAAGVSQTVSVADLVDDSIRMNAGALTRHEVRLVREYETQPVIEVDTHKVMQILVNLIRNAKYACDDARRDDKQMTLRITNDEKTVRIAVIDNGIGIPAENLTRIFSHGFTTRKEGHGFGLHSGALAAVELGGALLVHSDGPGCGATFTLELPFTSPKTIYGN